MNKNIEYMNGNINNLNRRLKDISDNTVSKKDAEEIYDLIEEIKEKLTTTEIVKTASPIEEIPVEKEADKPEEVIIEEIIAEKTIVATEQLEEPKEETPPPFAAFNRVEEDRIIVEAPTVRQIRPTQTARTAQENTQEKSYIERILGDNWLSKVGIITLVLGIAFFVKYAIDQNWINEVGRVGIGLLTGGIIVAIAHKLKAKYLVFSSILVGGGISVFYITITLAFREYQLFSQTIAFVLLIIVTVFSVLLSLLYNRKELAIFSLLGGFASPLMVSTGTGNYIVLFSYILILNTGMLAVSLMKKWRVIGIISYVLSLIFFWAWTLHSFESQYMEVTLFAILFFFQFYLLALIDHFKSEKMVTAYQAILILTNNLSLFLACLYIFNDYPYDIRGIVTIAIAIINAAIMLSLFRKSNVDKNLIYLIIAVVMTFVSLAIPIQLNGHVITMFWAAETVLLLWLWQKSQIRVFQIGFLLISALALLSYVIDVYQNYIYADYLPIILNRIFITGLVVALSIVINSLLLKKEDKNTVIAIRGFELCPMYVVVGAFKLLIIISTFVVPFLELNYQLQHYTDHTIFSSFRYVALATYTTLYITLLAFIFRKKLASKAYMFILLSLSVILYTFIYSYLVIELRFDIFYSGEYNQTYFLIHLLSLPAVASVIYLLAKNIKSISADTYPAFCWTMIIMAVITLSVETDNIVVLLFGNRENYDSLLYDVHTFVYPILWGIIAMILMIWGLNRKEVLLRKISLIFFGLIILKFYAYDVWHMSQTGRIVSFILLSVILLLVSFLQQKIKILVKDDNTDKKEEQEQN